MSGDALAPRRHATGPPEPLGAATSVVWTVWTSEEQDHQLAASASDSCDCRRAGRQERPREGEDDERQRRRAHQQQEPVAEPAAPDRLIGNPLHEHQRREFDDALFLPLHQVHEHRDGESAQAEEEDGS